jgi:hypothetical protein
MTTPDEASGDWLIQPPPETPDIRFMALEEWRIAVERWCQQFEAPPTKAPLSPEDIARVKSVLTQASESHTKRLAAG